MKAILAAALIAACLISCEFIGTDMFPKELQYAAGGYDLAAELGIEPDEIGELRIERLVSREGVSGVFAVIKRSLAWDLYIFNDEMKLIRKLQDGQFNRFLGSYQEPDSFICGTISIHSNFTYNADNQGGCSDNVIDVATSEYVIRQDDSDGIQTRIGPYQKNGLAGTGGLVSIVPNVFFDLLDSSVLFEISEETMPFLLVKQRGNESSSLMAVNFEFLSYIPSFGYDGPLNANVNVVLTPLLIEGADAGWVTEDGYIVLSHHDDTRLIRFDLVTGAELDSIKIDTNWMQGMSFEDSGEYWYYYDRRTGYIKKLRTWW